MNWAMVVLRYIELTCCLLCMLYHSKLDIIYFEQITMGILLLFPLKSYNMFILLLGNYISTMCESSAYTSLKKIHLLILSISHFFNGLDFETFICN